MQARFPDRDLEGSRLAARAPQVIGGEEPEQAAGRYSDLPPLGQKLRDMPDMCLYAHVPTIANRLARASSPRRRRGAKSRIFSSASVFG